MEAWQTQLKFDPLPALLASGDAALTAFVRRDLLGEEGVSIARLAQLPGAQRILKRQLLDGSWDRPTNKKDHPAINTALIETWRQFRFLVQRYGCDRNDPPTARAAEFLFACQTQAGDFRGFLANQYATYYTGAIMGLLIEAGYADDPRIEQGFRWLLAMRQADGGWTIPILTHNFDGATMVRLTSQYAEAVEPDRSKPFSHNWTGMILRAFAAHPEHRDSEAARVGAQLLKSRFFQPDCYSSYQDASYWVRFEYPFWWNNLVAALDSISRIDPSRDKPLEQALDWLIDHQEEDGLWKATYVSGKEVHNAKARETRLWVSLAICRILKRLNC